MDHKKWYTCALASTQPSICASALLLDEIVKGILDNDYIVNFINMYLKVMFMVLGGCKQI